MSGTSFAKLFRNGRSQAVRLPREFRLDGDRVRIRRVGKGVLLEPLTEDPGEWFAEIDRHAGEPLTADDRNQPMAPIRDVFE